MPFNFNGNTPTSITYNGNTVNTLTYNGTTVWTSAPVEADYLCFTANTAGSTVAMASNGTSAPSLTLSYSTDKETWNTFTVGETTITLDNIDDKVYFKGTNDKISFSQSHYNYFVMTGSISASGDITTLLNENGNILDLSSYSSHTFTYLFRNCASLTTAPSLPSTSLPGSCYYNMFNGCSNLINSPYLPATTFSTVGSQYQYMFKNCTSLVSISALPATENIYGCYQGMYYGCTNIKMSATRTSEYINEYTFGTTPTSSNAQNMFSNTGGTLKGTPTTQTIYTSNTIIPINYLCFTANEANSTISMKHQGGPNLTLYYSTDKTNWNDFIVGTTTITLTNVGDKVYFKGTNARGTGISQYDVHNNFRITGNVSISGDLTTLIDEVGNIKTLTSNQGFTSLFFNNNAITDVSNLILPSTTLQGYAYSCMFQLTNITTAPHIAATSMVTGSCSMMFYNCPNLNNVTVYFTEWGGTSSWLGEVASTGTFNCPSELDTETRGESRVPENWTVVNI